MARFTAERRERFLTLLETGRNVEQAAADVGVNPSTINRWAARGRAGATDDARAFAVRLDAIRGGGGERLTEDDVVRALEQAIRKGSVTAMRTWLHRYGKQAPAQGEPDEFDEFEGEEGCPWGVGRD